MGKKTWFRIVKGVPDDEADDGGEGGAGREDEDEDDYMVLAVDCSSALPDRFGLKLVRRAEKDEDDAAEPSVWRLSPSGQLICKRFDKLELALDAAPKLRYLQVRK
jgi:hypothetical protein